MANKRKQAADYFDNISEIEHYNKIYGELDFATTYPANLKRLEIFLSIIDTIKPSKIIDAGCGNGMPMIAMLEKGYSVSGYDKSENMLIQAKKNLVKYGFDDELASKNDFENPKDIKRESVDCITGMGTFYYSKNIEDTLVNQVSALKSGGSIIFSLRNRLFDLVTVNEYTSKFLRELYDIDTKDKVMADHFNEKMECYGETQEKKFQSIDDSNVYSSVHNPLDIDGLLQNVGLIKENIYFYHYHALPPSFEHIMQVQFRELSWKMEDPNNWKGHFLASNFVIHAIKKT